MIADASMTRDPSKWSSKTAQFMCNESSRIPNCSMLSPTAGPLLLWIEEESKKDCVSGILRGPGLGLMHLLRRTHLSTIL
jgi:hypothetical protein